VWKHLTKATLDSDYQADKVVIETNITALETRTTAVEAEIVSGFAMLNALESRVDTVELLSDSEAGRVQENIDKINTAFAMLDSDSINLQQIKTDLQTEIAATNADVSAINARLDSDETALQSLQTQVDALVVQDGVTEADHDSDVSVINTTISDLAMPIISGTQPDGKDGQLWINTNDGKLYYWNGVDAFVTIVTV
jgi:chromosome segregation ATPase